MALTAFYTGSIYFQFAFNLLSVYFPRGEAWLVCFCKGKMMDGRRTGNAGGRTGYAHLEAG